MEIAVPLILMTYFNPVFQYGLKVFVEHCKESGIDGVIIPDLPPEEAAALGEGSPERRFGHHFSDSPNQPAGTDKIGEPVEPGVYLPCLRHRRDRSPEGIARKPGGDVRRVKENSKKPVAVGFGISTPEQAKEVSRFADGIIVGSAIIRIMDESLNPTEMIGRVGDFVSSLKEALKPVLPTPMETEL